MQNMNLEQAQEFLENQNFKYVIFGFMPDGSRGIPPKFQFGILGATDESLHTHILQFTQGRVFLLEEVGKWPEWKERAMKAKKENDDKQEREIYERLKAKYEKNG